MKYSHVNPYYSWTRNPIIILVNKETEYEDETYVCDNDNPKGIVETQHSGREVELLKWGGHRWKGETSQSYGGRVSH